MLACPCPTCGASLPLTLASLAGVRCRSCGFAGPPPPSARERLVAAQHQLTHLDARARQFDASVRAAIGRALRARWGVIVALAVGALPFVGLTLVGAVKAYEHEGPTSNRVAGAIFIAVPMLVYATVGLLLDATVRSARMRLLASASATPPVHPGEAATCTVCGAPLVSRGVDPIVRCVHCAADNVVHPTAMARASEKRTMDLDALASALASRAHDLRSTARRVTVASVGSVLGTPFAAFVTVLGLLLSAKLLEPVVALPPSELARYAWVDTKRGSCVGLIVRSDDGTEAYFGGNDRLPNPSTIAPPDERALELLLAAALVGRRVRLAGGAEGSVKNVLGAPVTNREQLVLDTGARGDAAGACEASE